MVGFKVMPAGKMVTLREIRAIGLVISLVQVIFLKQQPPTEACRLRQGRQTSG